MNLAFDVPEGAAHAGKPSSCCDIRDGYRGGTPSPLRAAARRRRRRAVRRPHPSSSAVNLTPASFTADFSAMAQLKDLAAKGDGLIGVLLPDTTTSARYESYDRPYLKQAFEAAGLSSDRVQDRQRAGQRDDDADAGRGRHHQRRERAVDRRDRLRERCRDRGVGQGQGRRGDRLRPADQGRSRRPVLRQLRQRQRRQAHRSGRGRLHQGVEGEEAEHPHHGRRPHRQQRDAVRAGLQRRAEAVLRQRHLREGRRAGRYVDAGRSRPTPSSSSSRRTRTSTRSSRPTTTTPTR